MKGRKFVFSLPYGASFDGQWLPIVSQNIRMYAPDGYMVGYSTGGAAHTVSHLNMNNIKYYKWKLVRR